MRKRLFNYTIPEIYYDISNWPDLDISHLSESDQQTFTCRKNAITLYLTTDLSIKEICLRYNITSSSLYSLLDHCFMLQKSGIIYGFTALIPRHRRKKGNMKFNKLIQANTNFEAYLLNKFEKKSFKKLKILHEEFLRFLVKNGVSTSDYPFTLCDNGYKALTRYYNEWKMDQHATKLNNLKIAHKDSYPIYSTRSLEEVEVDGHRIDAYFITEFQTPSGTWREAIIERPWLLCAIDRSSRCILGYHLVLKSAYDADDVISCIEKAIIPQEYVLHNPYFKNLLQGGLPNTVFEDAQYALFDELYLDNALAHLANHTIDTFVKRLGIKLCFGKVAEPTRRGIIERFFQTLEENSFHALPSTTGYNKEDKRRTSPEKNAKKYQISVNDLEDILQLTIFHYNVKSHQSLFGNTPLEDFKQKFEGILQSYLPMELRTGEYFHIKIDQRKVISNSTKDNYLHINYSGAKYTNERLSKDIHLKGKLLTLHINRLDLRIITAFYPNGQLYGELIVEKKWRSRKHSLKERQIINKLSKTGTLSIYNNSNIIENYDHYLLNQRKPDKRTGTKIAKRNLDITQESTLTNQNRESTVHKKIPDPVELTKTRRKPFKIKSINL
ncbi:hypothetical protein V9Z70_04000 [Streptococcus suis]|uniref:hypothetical protein n=1 Tax=Streptococcus suis TaxID=1307 RepID=UPI002A7BBBD9|nr:hypothetical protein [Streptococcus suis]MDY7283275.1 hypothetical protein [Streptococcus suis]HEL1611494.1 transposase [Streptococcus suis]HEL2733969.1 transposase [Streptococcus suis]HEM3457751.1 transposase [Streptococcus suis]HEM4814197.1 transposase [Streptococcus suis]